MSMDASLVERLRALIDRYDHLARAHGDLQTRVVEIERERDQLAETCRTMRAQIDELDKDRFTLKQLKDERQVMRRKLNAALTRLARLEEELTS